MKRLILTALLIFGATAASAEPSSGVSALMNRPMSMLDWGMYKMRERLQQVDATVYVDYNWEANEIRVFSYAGLASKPSSMEEAKLKCDKSFAIWDGKLSISDGTEMFDICSICGLFSHNGFSFNGFDEAIKDLKERIYYGAYQGQYSCKRKLYGKTASTSVSER